MEFQVLKSVGISVMDLGEKTIVIKSCELIIIIIIIIIHRQTLFAVLQILLHFWKMPKVIMDYFVGCPDKFL
jgi:hypothetical protein